MVDSVIGPYRIIRLLGEGGMGAVYEAVNDSIERHVAIKVLHPDYARKPDVVSRFFNEARTVNRIAHPSLVQIHEQGSLADGTAYIVMEYLKGQTLSQRLQQVGGRLPVRTAVQIAWQVAAALSAAHGKDIIHRDLNPSNLMLVPDPFGPGGERVKVLDFGIAKLFSEVTEGKAAQLIMGTPLYMSPEQYHGADSVDDRTDVYSLGTILFEMLAGRPPFLGEGAGELVGMHLFRAPPSLLELVPEVPPELSALTEQLLNKEKSQRPSMQEVSAQLAQFAARYEGSFASGIQPVVMTSAASSSLASSLQHGKSSAPVRRSWGRLLIAALAGSLAAGSVLLMVRTLSRFVSSRQGQVAPSTGPERASPIGAAANANSAATTSPSALPHKAWRSSAVKLPPLRTALDLPIVPMPRPGSAISATRPSGLSAAEVDSVLSNAQRDYLMHDYGKAIELAKKAQQESPLRAWRIVGASACGLKDLKLLKESYLKLDGAGRQYLYFVCQKVGISTDGLAGGAKP